MEGGQCKGMVFQATSDRGGWAKTTYFAVPCDHVPVGCGEVAHDGNGFTGGLCALQRDPDEVAVVHPRRLPGKGGQAAKRRLADGELVLVHVAHHVVRVRGLLDVPQVHPAVPVPHLARRAGGVVGSRVVPQRPVEVAVVRGVGNLRRGVLACAFGDKVIRAGGRRRDKRQQREGAHNRGGAAAHGEQGGCDASLTSSWCNAAA